ncbi:unnamed protein product [Ectocarpus fasciculatus]
MTIAAIPRLSCFRQIALHVCTRPSARSRALPTPFQHCSQNCGALSHLEHSMLPILPRGPKRRHPQLRVEHEVLEAGQRLGKHVLLSDVAGDTADLRGRHRSAVDPDGPGDTAAAVLPEAMHPPGQHVQESRLPRAGGAHDGGNATGP